MTQGDILPDAQKLTGANYQTWKSRCKLLMKEGTWKYVDPAGTNTPIAGEADDIVQARVKALYSINMSCHEAIFNTLAEFTDPRAAWKNLQTQFASASNASRLMLLDKLNALRLQEGGSVSEYLKQINEIKLELKGVGHDISETDLVERMLGTLPASYESVYQQVSGLTAIPTLENMSTRFLQAETQLHFRQASTGILPTNVEALAARFQRNSLNTAHRPPFQGNYPSSGRPPFQPGYRPSNPSGERRCNWCGSPTHLMRNCHDLAQEISRRARDRQHPTHSSQSSRSNAPVYHSHLLMADSPDPTSDGDPVDVFDVALAGIDLEQEGSWIMDSGCSKHVSGTPDAFSSLQIQPSLAMVQTAGNQYLPVEGKGTVNLDSSGEINISDVYYVPGLAFNLLLVGSITDMGLTVVFDDLQCLIYQGPNKIIGRGVRDSKTGLYRYLIPDPTFQVCAITAPFVARLWHRRLGHLNYHSIRAMGAHNIARGVPLIPAIPALCDSCLSGKQSREPARKATT
jgi:hypothetical protein